MVGCVSLFSAGAKKTCKNPVGLCFAKIGLSFLGLSIIGPGGIAHVTVLISTLLDVGLYLKWLLTYTSASLTRDM